MIKSNWFELSPGSRQEKNLHCEHSKFLPICPKMKIANFWLERDYLTVMVSSEGAFKDKNNGTRNFNKYGQIITRKWGFNSNQLYIMCSLLTVTGVWSRTLKWLTWKMMDCLWSGACASGLPSSVNSDKLSHPLRQLTSSKLTEIQKLDHTYSIRTLHVYKIIYYIYI